MATDKGYYSLVVTGGSLTGVDGLTGNAMRGVLDMLRYDTALVTEVHEDYIIIRTPRRPTDERWRSYGLEVVGTGGPVDYSWQSNATRDAIAIYNERMERAAAKTAAATAEAG